MFYTEKDTRFIYDVKLFDDCILVRPLAKGLESPVEKLNTKEFDDRFEEFCGDPQRVYEIMGDELFVE